MDTGITPVGHMVDQVIEFNNIALGIHARDKALLSDKELKYAKKAILEELAEFEVAHEQQDFIGAVDAILDKLYFGIGFLYRMGLTSDEIKKCFASVHNCNMAKKVGTQSKRGGEGVVDAVKPEGWVGPEEAIAAILGG